MNLFRYQYVGWYDSYSETISFLTEDIWTPWPTCIYSQMHQNARGTHAHTHFISFYLCFQFQFIFCFIFSLYPCARHQTAILASSVDQKVMHQSFEAPHPHPTPERNTSWWLWGDCPHFSPAIPGVGVGVIWPAQVNAFLYAFMSWCTESPCSHTQHTSKL